MGIRRGSERKGGWRKKREVERGGTECKKAGTVNRKGRGRRVGTLERGRRLARRTIEWEVGGDEGAERREVRHEEQRVRRGISGEGGGLRSKSQSCSRAQQQVGNKFGRSNPSG